MIAAGELNTYITLQKKTEGKGAQGEPTENWVDYISLWSKKVGLSDKEYIDSRQLQNEYEVKYIIRDRHDLDRYEIAKKMRVLDDDTALDIVSIMPSKNKDDLIIRAVHNG